MAAEIRVERKQAQIDKKLHAVNELLNVSQSSRNLQAELRGLQQEQSDALEWCPQATHNVPNSQVVSQLCLSLSRNMIQSLWLQCLHYQRVVTFAVGCPCRAIMVAVWVQETRARDGPQVGWHLRSYCRQGMPQLERHSSCEGPSVLDFFRPCHPLCFRKAALLSSTWMRSSKVVLFFFHGRS